MIQSLRHATAAAALCSVALFAVPAGAADFIDVDYGSAYGHIVPGAVYPPPDGYALAPVYPAPAFPAPVYPAPSYGPPDYAGLDYGPPEIIVATPPVAGYYGAPGYYDAPDAGMIFDTPEGTLAVGLD